MIQWGRAPLNSCGELLVNSWVVAAVSAILYSCLSQQESALAEMLCNLFQMHCLRMRGPGPRKGGGSSRFGGATY
jgi:hypothetical protein